MVLFLEIRYREREAEVFAEQRASCDVFVDEGGFVSGAWTTTFCPTTISWPQDQKRMFLDSLLNKRIK